MIHQLIQLFTGLNACFDQLHRFTEKFNHVFWIKVGDFDVFWVGIHEFFETFY